MTWGWRPTGAPTAGEASHGADWVSWWWTITLREGDRRRVEIQLSASLIASADGPDLPGDLREAVATRGRSEITRIALWEEPPELILVSVHGRERIGGYVASASGDEGEDA